VKSGVDFLGRLYSWWLACVSLAAQFFWYSVTFSSILGAISFICNSSPLPQIPLAGFMRFFSFVAISIELIQILKVKMKCNHINIIFLLKRHHIYSFFIGQLSSNVNLKCSLSKLMLIISNSRLLLRKWESSIKQYLQNNILRAETNIVKYYISSS
jgi:membrane protease YdiL (CAAX protease family)